MLTRFSLSAVLLAMMAVAQVQATGLRPDQISIALLERLHYFQTFTPKRQSNTSVPLSDFPTQCQSGCRTAVNALNTCSAATCLCNAAVDSSLSYCINCSVNTVPSASVVQSGQQVVDTYNTLCKGTSVSTITLNITAPLQSTSTSSTGTGTGTSINFGSGSASVTTGGPTTTITVPLPTGSTPATGASSASSTGGSSTSTAVGTRTSVGYAFIPLIIALLPLLA